MTPHSPQLFHIVAAVLVASIGLALGNLGRRGLGPAPRRANILWSLSLVCAWLGLTCWPHAVTTLIDDATHIPGLAHIVSDTLITSAFVLQFAFTCTIEKGGWTWARMGASALYVAILIAYAIQWGVLHNGYSFYGTYAAHPPALLRANITLVALILWSSGLCIKGYVGYLRANADSSVRVMIVGVMIVAGLAAFYGVLILGQLVTSALGFGSTEITSVTGPILGLASMTAAVVVWLLTGQRTHPLRSYVRSVFALRQREIELDERERRIRQRDERVAEREGKLTDLAVWVQEQLVQIHVEVDERPVNEVITWCAAAGVSLYKANLGVMTTRLALLSRAHILRITRYDLDLIPDEDDDTDSANHDLIAAIEEEEDILSDLMRMLQLVDPRPLPEGIEPRVEPPGWRLDLAHAISVALSRPRIVRRRQRRSA